MAAFSPGCSSLELIDDSDVSEENQHAKDFISPPRDVVLTILKASNSTSVNIVTCKQIQPILISCYRLLPSLTKPLEITAL